MMNNTNGQKTVWDELTIQELEIVVRYFEARCKELHSKEFNISTLRMELEHERNLTLTAYTKRRRAQLAQAHPTPTSAPQSTKQESATTQDWFTFMGIHFLLNGDFHVPATYMDITGRVLSQSEYPQARTTSSDFYYKWRESKDGCEDATVRYALLQHFAASYSLSMDDIKRSVSFDADSGEFSLVAWSALEPETDTSLQASHASKHKQSEDNSNDNPTT